MAEDYFDAANRHMHDAKLLRAQTSPSLENASHLAGIAAECALKAILQHYSNGAQARIHLPSMWQHFACHSSMSRRSGLRTRIAAQKMSFDQWDIGQRYEPRGATFFEVALVDGQLAAAAVILSLSHQTRAGTNI